MNKSSYFLFPYQGNHTEKKVQGNENEKIKFSSNSRAFNNPDCKCESNDNPIDVESFLRNSYAQSKNKTSIQLSREFNPQSFNINYQDRKPIGNFSKKTMPRYFNDMPYTGPGRGMGDVSISDNTRFGVDTRRYNEEFRNINESTILDRFDFLDKDFQNPSNIVLPFPQGGVQTRDNKKLIKHTKKNFDFQY